MQLHGETDDLAFCLSFNCYFSDNNLTASAASKVICEFSDVIDEEDFEFSSHISDDLIFPVSDAVEENDDASPVIIQLQNSSVDRHEYDEIDELKPSGMFCMWRPLVIIARYKKSRSTGSGSGSSSGSSTRRWRIWNSLRRSNSDGASKERRRVNAEEMVKVAGKMKTSSFHEVFYVQKRAEQKGDKMKSFLPYKQDLLGLFVNSNRIGNKRLLF